MSSINPATVPLALQAHPSARTILCIVALAIFTVIFFAPVLLRGDAMFPAADVAGDPVWRSLAMHWQGETNGAVGDHVDQFYPWSLITRQGLSEGVLPQWNPYVAAGAPFFNTLQPGVLYPLNLLLLPALPQQVAGLRAALSLFLAAVGMLLFLRSLGLSHGPALLGALAFGYGQFNVAWTGNSIGTVVIWLPWILLALRRVLGGASLLWAVALSAVWATCVLGGHVESALHLALFAAAFGIWQLLPLRRTPALLVRRAALALAAVSLGIGLAAIQIVPALLAAPGYIATALRSGPVNLTAAVALGTPSVWVTAVTALVPDFFGNPTRTGYWYTFPWMNYSEGACYVGTPAMVLALSRLRAWRLDSITRFFVPAGLVCAGMAFAWPGFALLDSIYPLTLTLIGRLRLELSFCIALVAAVSLDRLLRQDGPRTLAVALLTAARWWLVLAVGPLLMMALVLTGLLRLGPVASGVDLWSFLPLLWATLMALVVVVFRHGATGPLVAAVLLIQSVDLYQAGATYNPQVPISHVEPLTPLLRSLQVHAAGYRIAGIGSLVSDIPGAFSLRDAQDYDPAGPNRFRLFFNQLVGRTTSTVVTFSSTDARALQRPIVDALGLRYVIAAQPLPGLAGTHWRIIRAASPVIYQNLAALPRAFLVPALRCVPSWQDEVAAATSPALPVRQVAVTTCAAGQTLAHPTGLSSLTGAVMVRQNNLNTLTISATTPAAGFLVLSELADPGWSVRDNGRTVTARPCDGILQCVPITAGTHTLVYTYEAPGLPVGEALTIISALVLLAALAYGLIGLRFAPRHARSFPSPQ